MQRTNSLISRLMLISVLMLSMVFNYHYCFAEDSPNNTIQKEPTTSTETDLQKKVIDFSNGEQGFKLDTLWKIQDNELQFIPNESTKSRFYYNPFQNPLSNYIISVNIRWIDGPDYSSYGLLFKNKNDSYYAFLIQLNSYVFLAKHENGKWKTIKSIRSKSLTHTLYDSLKVICDGPSIKCFLNEKQIFETKDKEPINNTYFGLCSDGNVQCGFKDFTYEELPVSN
jgi:hypothetical protein